ncbi:ankyrin, partial [Glonium stellatum]
LNGVNGGRYLQQVARKGHFNVVKTLIDHGADANPSLNVRYPEAPLYIAYATGDLEMMKYLVDAGANANALASYFQGVTALQDAIETVGVASAQSLLEAGADVNAPGSEIYGETAIQKAALIRRGYIKLVEYALSRGADIHRFTEGKEGRSPIQLAAEQGSLQIAKVLFSHGASVHAPATINHGWTALQAAVSSAQLNLKLIEFLLTQGADINAPPCLQRGVIALQGAAIGGHVKIVYLLVRKGANVNATPSIIKERTALDGAAEHGRLDVVQLLIESGATSESFGENGFKRAMELAEDNGHFEVVKLLRKQ